MYFMNFIVINLKERTDRLTWFKNNFFNNNLKIFNAYDYRNVDLELLYNNKIIGKYGYDTLKNKKRNYHHELSSYGAIGCYMSHVNIWYNIYNNKIINTFIFEDDTIVNKNIKNEEIIHRLKLLPNNWDIYLLSNPDLCYNKTLINKNGLYKVNRFFCTNAYIINYNGAKKIIKNGNLFPINQQIDSYLSELCLDYDLNIYIHDNDIFTSFIQNQNFITDIQDDYSVDELSFDRYRII